MVTASIKSAPSVLLSACLAVLSLDCAAVAADAPRRPNIVFVLADDLGWTDLGCQGSHYYETPNIDRLASQGLKMTRYYHSQNCAPTRAALMTGQYAPRTGVYTVGQLDRGGQRAARKMDVPENVTKLPLDRQTVADVLRGAGYATGMFGKWHLGGGEHHPSHRGFDEAIESAGRHFEFGTQPKVDYPKGTYLADWLTDRAVEFIDKHRHEPFFLYLPHFGVHSPYQAKPELIARFKDKAPSGGHFDPTYAAMICSVDESVGRIMDKLDELKLAEDTVLIFSSDNGGVGGHDLPSRATGHTGITDNSPLRGGKGMLYEGGIRVPMIVRWPGVVRPGSTCDTPAVHVDLLPTLAQIAGARLPEQPLDGVSLAALWRDPAAGPQRQAIYYHFPGYLEGANTMKSGWRTTPVGVMLAGEWKLLEFFEDGRCELYSLRDDIGERHDLAGQQPDRLSQMRARLSAWREELGAAMPTPRAESAAEAGARPRRRARQQAN